MDREEIRFVQARYHQLNLSAEQAEKVLRYEDMKDSDSRTHMFSAWEQWDFEYSVFQELLSKGQMLQYRRRMKKIRDTHIEQLAEQDKANEISVSQTQEQTEYLKNELIPSILSNIFRLATLSIGHNQSKIEYLKANYAMFLHDQRKQILVDHFRYNKTYAPIQLKSALARHYTSCLLPNYVAFENWIDEPTRAVADFLKAELSRSTSELTKFYLGKRIESKAFSEQLFEKYYRNIEWGTIWTLDPLPEEEENTNWLMSMLLLDKNAYGFEPID